MWVGRRRETIKLFTSKVAPLQYHFNYCTHTFCFFFFEFCIDESHISRFSNEIFPFTTYIGTALSEGCYRTFLPHVSLIGPSLDSVTPAAAEHFDFYLSLCCPQRAMTLFFDSLSSNYECFSFLIWFPLVATSFSPCRSNLRCTVSRKPQVKTT